LLAEHTCVVMLDDHSKRRACVVYSSQANQSAQDLRPNASAALCRPRSCSPTQAAAGDTSGRI